MLLIILLILILIIIIVLYNISKNNIKEFTNINTNCKYRRFGCCNDEITPKLDFIGSNCRGF